MRPEIVARHINALGWDGLKELARVCMEARGFRLPTDSDGWSDGGRDLRVYLTRGVRPSRFAIQTSVERRWKAKLREDIKKANEKLNCHSFIYITNRRIDDTAFEKMADDAVSERGVHLAKMDEQDLARFVLDRGLLDWLMQYVGVPDISSVPDLKSIQDEAIDVFVIMSDDARDFRKSMLEHALKVCAAHGEHTPRDILVQNAAGAIGVDGIGARQQLGGAIDRLLQREELLASPDGIAASQDVQREINAAIKLQQLEWSEFLADLERTLKPFLPRNAKAGEAANVIAQHMGVILTSYREYQSKILSGDTTQDLVRPKWAREADKTSAQLMTVGVKEDRVPACLGKLRDLARSHPVLQRLKSAEVFRRLMSVDKDQLLGALGGGHFCLHLDPNVAIPLLCAKLHRAKPDSQARSTVALHDVARALGAKIAIPSPYLEECATHLVDAKNYAPVVKSNPGDLRLSQNAYVSYFARAGLSTLTFSRYLRSFGLRVDEDGEFYSLRDRLVTRLNQLFQKYGIAVIQVTHRELDPHIRKQAEKDLAFIYRKMKQTRPDVLARHDAFVLSYVRQECQKTALIPLLVTWDKTLLTACMEDAGRWWALDPANAADLVGLATGESSVAGSVEVALGMAQEEQERAAKLWDTIVALEKENLTDAELLLKAQDFRDSYLSAQKVDLRRNAIARRWEDFKSSHVG